MHQVRQRAENVTANPAGGKDQERLHSLLAKNNEAC